MSWLETIKKIIKIQDWLIDRWGGIVDWIKKTKRAWYEASVDSAVDRRDAGKLRDIIVRIKQKRNNRRDAS